MAEAIRRNARRIAIPALAVAAAGLAGLAGVGNDRLSFRRAGDERQVTVEAYSLCGGFMGVPSLPEFDIGGTHWVPDDRSTRHPLVGEQREWRRPIAGSFVRLSADTAELRLADHGRTTFTYRAAGADWVPLVPICSVGS